MLNLDACTRGHTLTEHAQEERTKIDARATIETLENHGDENRTAC